MINPFNEVSDREKYLFYNEMTEAINKWMLYKYPAFDTLLVDKLKAVKKMHNDLETQFSNHREAVKNEREEVLKYYQERLDKYMMEKYPDLSNRLSQLAIDLQETCKKQGKIQKETQETMKQIKIYKSLCEDVYAIKDQVKEMKSVVDEYNKKLKRAFA
jgi:hypothetical protein